MSDSLSASLRKRRLERAELELDDAIWDYNHGNWSTRPRENKAFTRRLHGAIRAVHRLGGDPLREGDFSHQSLDTLGQHHLWEALPDVFEACPPPHAMIARRIGAE